MTDRNEGAQTKRVLAAAFGLWLVACGRVGDSTPFTGAPAQAADAGAGGALANAGTSAAGAARAGAGGTPNSLGDPLESGGQSATYPPPFDTHNCSAPLSPDLPYQVRCVTRGELEDSQLPDLTLDGGVSMLGTETAWRCPELHEITFSGPCGGERCCAEAACGPLVQRTSSGISSDAGTAGAGGDFAGEQVCCYLVQTVCGV